MLRRTFFRVDISLKNDDKWQVYQQLFLWQNDLTKKARTYKKLVTVIHRYEQFCVYNL